MYGDIRWLKLHLCREQRMENIVIVQFLRWNCNLTVDQCSHHTFWRKTELARFSQVKLSAGCNESKTWKWYQSSQMISCKKADLSKCQTIPPIHYLLQDLRFAWGIKSRRETPTFLPPATLASPPGESQASASAPGSPFNWRCRENV